MRVVWTELAHEQLDAAMAYIARDRPATAMRWLEHLLDTAGSLSEFPDLGRLVEGANRDDIRELIVSPYRIIYRHDVDAIYVTMVLHDRRDLDVDSLG
jgi:plasmid stabilization system protein ParE